MDLGVPWYWSREGLFAGLDDAIKSEFFAHSQKQEYKKGSHVFLAGSAASKVFYLESGMVRIYYLSALGHPITFWLSSPGSLLGMDALYGNPHHMFYAQAVQACKVFSISPAAIDEIMNAHPAVAIRIIRLTGARLRLACETLTDLASRSTDMRLARLLLRLGYHWGKSDAQGTELTIRIPNEELANMIGASRQTVNVVLHHFRDAGWIRFRGRYITILEPDLLRQFADQA